MTTIGKHGIRSVWETVLADIKQALTPVNWTSIDVLRIGFPFGEGGSPEPVVVWVGVGDEAKGWETIAGVLCNVRDILDHYNLQDVECEMRLSRVVALAGTEPSERPQLMRPLSPLDPRLDIMQPFTTTLGQPIAPIGHLHIEGTLGLYLQPAADTKEVPPLWGLTCWHVVFPEAGFVSNKFYEREDGDNERFSMVLPANKAFDEAVDFVEDRISLAQQDIRQTANEFERQQKEKSLQPFKELEQVLHAMRPPDSRVVGTVLAATPMEPKTLQIDAADIPRLFMRDWALIELDQSKFPEGRRPQSIVDLRTSMTSGKMEKLINSKIVGDNKFKFPDNGLMRLQGIIPMCEIANPPPTAMDEDQDDCHILFMRGRSSGLTIGTASEIKSTTRQFADGREFETREWAVMSIHGKKAGQFSTCGDSGAVVFDTRGRIGGMITGGTSNSERLITGIDITNVTPMPLLLADIESTMGVSVELL